MKIVISGNSVPLEIYPKEKPSFRFGEVFALTDSFDVIHSCQAKKTVKEGYENITGDVIVHFPDYAVLSYGIVECFPLLLWQRMSKQNFRKYLELIIKEIRLHTNAKIILVGILPVSKYWALRNPDVVANIYRFNRILSDVAVEYAVEFIDVSDLGEYTQYQGFHLNAEGHGKLYTKIRKIMK